MDRYNRYSVGTNCPCGNNARPYPMRRSSVCRREEGRAFPALVSIEIQEFKELYAPCEALDRGTLFAELYKPYCIRGGGCR